MNQPLQTLIDNADERKVFSKTISFSEYTEQATTTAVFPEDQALGYLGLGLVNEIEEVLEKVYHYTEGDNPQDLEGEIGDVLWYVAVMTHYADLTDPVRFKVYHEPGIREATRTKVQRSENHVLLALRFASKLAGKLKKTIRDDGGTPNPERAQEISVALNNILSLLAGAARVAGILTVPEIAQANLDKLFDRKERGTLKGDGDKR